MSEDDDIDRAAILARRQRFIGMTIAGLVSGCRPSAESSEPPELTPECEELADELAALPEPPELRRFYTGPLDERTRAYAMVLDEAAREHCYAVALQGYRDAQASLPDHGSFVYNLGIWAYQAGEHASARAALTYLLEHAHTLRVRPDERRYARRLLQDLEEGRSWEETRRNPRPQVCLSRRID